MPRYYFHVHDSADVPDKEGVVLSGSDEARRQAVIASGEMLKDFGIRLWSHPDWRMWVTDEAGKTICTLAVIAESTG